MSESEEIEGFLESHEVYANKNILGIKLKIPNEFKKDFKEVIVEYDSESKSKAVVCDGVKRVFNEIENKPIKEFVDYLEQNFSELIKSSTKTCTKLPSNFKFPVNSINPNVILDRSVENISLFTCTKPNVKVACTRCKTVQNIDSDASCIKCGILIEYKYLPCINTNSLGFLNIKNANVILFDISRYQFSCSECGTAYESMPISLRKNFIINCYECHSLIKFCVQNIQLINKQKVAIKQGTELPNKGACDHYSKSLRWFRFPCCNHLFPCDICHNKQMKHKADLATNMVCGLCSKEQSVKKECPCDMNMIAKTSRFWEGGKGNRNKQTLSKKDSRKYK